MSIGITAWKSQWNSLKELVSFFLLTCHVKVKISTFLTFLFSSYSYVGHNILHVVQWNLALQNGIYRTVFNVYVSQVGSMFVAETEKSECFRSVTAVKLATNSNLLLKMLCFLCLGKLRFIKGTTYMTVVLVMLWKAEVAFVPMEIYKITCNDVAQFKIISLFTSALQLLVLSVKIW